MTEVVFFGRYCNVCIIQSHYPTCLLEDGIILERKPYYLNCLLCFVCEVIKYGGRSN